MHFAVSVRAVVVGGKLPFAMSAVAEWYYFDGFEFKPVEQGTRGKECLFFVKKKNGRYIVYY